MLNEQRIYLMTQLAIFEKEHQTQLRGAGDYFRSDYIGGRMIKNGFRVTIAFFLMLAGWGLYNAETLIFDITKMDVRALAVRIVLVYFMLMAVFLLFTYIHQAIRYSRAREDLEHYREMLEQLEQSYREEDERKRIILQRRAVRR